MSTVGRKAGGAGLAFALWLAFPMAAQRGAKSTARDLFYSEAALIASPGSHKGRFATAKTSVIAVTLGLKYRLWKLVDGQAVEVDPGEAFEAGDEIRLGVEANDIGYLYIVHRQPSGQWRRLFPDPAIEHGSHFVRSGLVYPIPPEEGIELQFPPGGERFFLLLSRAPVKELEALVSLSQPETAASAAGGVEISEAALGNARNLLNSRELVTERYAPEKAVYVANRTGKPDSVVGVEIRLAAR